MQNIDAYSIGVDIFQFSHLFSIFLAQSLGSLEPPRNGEESPWTERKPDLSREYGFLEWTTSAEGTREFPSTRKISLERVLAPISINQARDTRVTAAPSGLLFLAELLPRFLRLKLNGHVPNCSFVIEKKAPKGMRF